MFDYRKVELNVECLSNDWPVAQGPWSRVDIYIDSHLYHLQLVTWLLKSFSSQMLSPHTSRLAFYTSVVVFCTQKWGWFADDSWLQKTFPATCRVLAGLLLAIELGPKPTHQWGMVLLRWLWGRRQPQVIRENSEMVGSHNWGIPNGWMIYNGKWRMM